jgi:hypothetical protein
MGEWRVINSPRHQTSRWLKAAESSTVGWFDAIFSRASVHPVPLPRHVAVEVLWHSCSDAMHWRCVGSSGAKDSALKSPLLASTWPLDRPALHLDQGVGSSGAEGFVLARLCMNSNWASDRPTGSPLRPSDRPTLHLDQGDGSSGAEGFVLARLCMNSNWASDRPTGSPLRPSDHPVLLASLLFLCNSSDATK